MVMSALSKRESSEDISLISTASKVPATGNQHKTIDSIGCYAVNLGKIEYNQAWKLQSELVSMRIKGIIETDIILFLEHPTVFTLGRRGGLDNLLVSEKFLQTSKIPIVHVERGGDITFHGPGQLVVYPILNLEAHKMRVVEFVEALEKVMIDTAKTWGIKAQRNSVNRGVWVGEKKLGSIGIALRKGICFHGLALNVNIDLTPFSWIQPCGLQGICMTSMKQELGRNIPMDSVRKELKEHLISALNVEPKTIGIADLQHRFDVILKSFDDNNV